MIIFDCSSLQVGRDGEPAMCGVITDTTRLVFRSRSAHVTVMIQLSKEMWEFAEDGDVHIERVRY